MSRTARMRQGSILVAVASPIYGLPLRCKRVSASGLRIGLQQYIRPCDASVDAGPDDIRSQEPRNFLGVCSTARAIRLFLRRSDLFPSATTLWQSWRVAPPRARPR